MTGTGRRALLALLLAAALPADAVAQAPPAPPGTPPRSLPGDPARTPARNPPHTPARNPARPRRRAAVPAQPAAARPHPIDRPGQPGGDLAPVPDRRFPTREQTEDPRTTVIPGVPTGRQHGRGSSFLDRDPNPESLGRGRDSLVPEPGVSLRVPFR